MNTTLNLLEARQDLAEAEQILKNMTEGFAKFCAEFPSADTTDFADRLDVAARRVIRFRIMAELSELVHTGEIMTTGPRG